MCVRVDETWEVEACDALLRPDNMSIILGEAVGCEGRIEGGRRLDEADCAAGVYANGEVMADAEGVGRWGVDERADEDAVREGIA